MPEDQSATRIIGPGDQAGAAHEGPRLLVISPTKDEAAYLPRTIDSMVRQTFRPALWIIVDDGSSDATGAIADRAAEQHPWIRVLHRPSGTPRRVGPGVVEAFYAGLSQANLEDYDLVCKLDGDLEFSDDYFKILMARFDANPRLGTASGKTYIPLGGRFVLERTSDQFSHGVAKLYRRQCFDEIGGFVHEVMWDGIDCHRCRMLGWEAVSYDEPDLAIKHLRQMGSSFKSIYHGRMRWGRGQFFMGTHPAYILASSIYRMAERPWVLGGLCIAAGYFQAAWQRRPRYEDPEFREHLHRWQFGELKRMLSLKSRSRPAAMGRDSRPPGSAVDPRQLNEISG
jgi:glycosyltransferase involved in cell wall biosynthesis